MKKSKPRIIKKWLDLAVSPQLLLYLLPYMMFLLIAGTVAQKYVGLFTATKIFFTSFVFWVGFIPLPGGATALALLFVNLAAYFITKSKWSVQTFGSSLTHLGVIVLLLGGVVTLIDKQEGFIILRDGKTADAFYGYHTRYFDIEKNGRLIWRSDVGDLKTGQLLHLRDFPSPLRIETLYTNSMLDETGKLQEIPAQKDEETNQAGMKFSFTQNGKTISKTTTEFLAEQPILKDKKDTYHFILKRASVRLPFKLEMQKLTQELYPGVDTAKSYETRFNVIEADHTWPAHVSMNDPLRYKGYTFYQASVLTLPNGEQASVLNAVKDAGWFFPYAATALVSIGLLINAWVRRHAKK